MRRRRLLQGGALGGLAGLAGFGYVLSSAGDSSNDGGASVPQGPSAGTPTQTPDSDGPSEMDVSPTITTVRIDAPDTVSVDESFELTISAANEGDKTGSFQATLTVTGPEDHSETVRIQAISPGETGETTTSMSVSYAGTYTARLEGRHIETEITVQPRDATLGEAVNVDNQLELTIENTRVEPTLFAEGEGPYYLDPPVRTLLPLEDRTSSMLVVVEGSITNPGDDAVTFDPAALSLSAAAGSDPAFYQDMGQEIFTGVPLAGTQLEGEPLAGRELQPGESISGWLLAPVGRTTLTGGRLDLGIQRDDEGPLEAVWSIIPAGGANLPAFDVEDISMPESTPNTQTGEFAVTVTNTGDESGTFRDVLEISSNLPEFDPVGHVTGTVAPGETKELTGEFLMVWGGRQGFNLQRSETELVLELEDYEEVDGVQAVCEGGWIELDWGEKVTMPNGVGVKLSVPAYANELAYSPENRYTARCLVFAMTAFPPEWALGTNLGKKLLPHLNDIEYNWFGDMEHLLPPLRFENEEVRSEAEEGENTLTKPVAGPVYPITPPETIGNENFQGWVEMLNPEREGTLPDREREMLLIKRIKPTDDGESGKGVWIKWSHKFGSNESIQERRHRSA